MNKIILELHIVNPSTRFNQSINAERVPDSQGRASAYHIRIALRRIRIHSGGVLLSSHRGPSSSPPIVASPIRGVLDGATRLVVAVAVVLVVVVYAGFDDDDDDDDDSDHDHDHDHDNDDDDEERRRQQMSGLYPLSSREAHVRARLAPRALHIAPRVLRA